MRKSLFLFFLLYSTILFAQNDADVLRYSQIQYGSTARSMGMANSFGALGADMSTFATNPAGIGLYRSSQASISTLFSNRYLLGQYLSREQGDNRFKFSFGNFGAVWVGSDNNHNNIRWSFGIAYNKMNDFNSKNTIAGTTTNHNLLNSYLEEIGSLSNIDSFGVPLYHSYDEYQNPNDLYNNFPYDIDLAYQTYLIDTIDLQGDTYYYSAIPFNGTKQTRTIQTKGNQGEWDFTLGMALEEKLYIGGTLGITTIRYNEKTEWKEEDIADTIPLFNNYKYTQEFISEGNGVNFKLGLIYKPKDWIRFGAAIHTATAHHITDQYDAKMTANFNSSTGVNEVYELSGPEFLPLQYKIRTPYRMIGSLGIIAGKYAAVNVDYEYLNYGNSAIKTVSASEDLDFSAANSAIKNKYGASHNIRIGAELRYEIWRLRAGAFQQTSPFKTESRPAVSIDHSIAGFSLGTGVRLKNITIDIGYLHSEKGEYFRPYTMLSKQVDGFSYKTRDDKVMVTIGWNI